MAATLKSGWEERTKAIVLWQSTSGRSHNSVILSFKQSLRLFSNRHWKSGGYSGPDIKTGALWEGLWCEGVGRECEVRRSVEVGVGVGVGVNVGGWVDEVR